jgi:hypothetical protein
VRTKSLYNGKDHFGKKYTVVVVVVVVVVEFVYPDFSPKLDSNPYSTRLGTDSYFSLAGKSTAEAIYRLQRLYISVYVYV